MVKLLSIYCTMLLLLSWLLFVAGSILNQFPFHSIRKLEWYEFKLTMYDPAMLRYPKTTQWLTTKGTAQNKPFACLFFSVLFASTLGGGDGGVCARRNSTVVTLVAASICEVVRPIFREVRPSVGEMIVGVKGGRSVPGSRNGRIRILRPGVLSR